jgi:hypothetical protein
MHLSLGLGCCWSIAPLLAAFSPVACGTTSSNWETEGKMELSFWCSRLLLSRGELNLGSLSIWARDVGFPVMAHTRLEPCRDEQFYLLRPFLLLRGRNLKQARRLCLIFFPLRPVPDRGLVFDGGSVAGPGPALRQKRTTGDGATDGLTFVVAGRLILLLAWLSFHDFASEFLRLRRRYQVQQGSDLYLIREHECASPCACFLWFTTGR